MQIQVEWGQLTGNSSSVVVLGDSVTNMYTGATSEKSQRISVVPLQVHFHCALRSAARSR